MQHRTRITLTFALLSGLLSGCAGSVAQQARQGLLAPAATRAWPLVKTLATEGANARHDADHDDAAWRIDLDLIDQFDQGVRNLGVE